MEKIRRLIKTKWKLLSIIICSIIGIVVSFILSYDYNLILINKELVLPCSINETFNCSSVMKSQYSSLLGFPNSWIGILGYGMILGSSISLFLSKEINSNQRKLLFALILPAFLFSWFLFIISSVVLKTFCPYCLLSFVSSNILILLCVNLKND